MDESTEMDARAEETRQVVQPRAYQLELFEKSMRENVIVTMDTGSGKTQVAKLRIEAELDRCSAAKLVWFLVPTVLLAEQQHKYLADQLPAYQSKLICGADNVEHWSTPAIWDAVLRDVRIVVSTPRILLDALVHGFVRMSRITLLVFDEAHHCAKSHDTNRIMQEFYHVDSPGSDAEARPHILGLSASPITNAKRGALEKLEQNLNAICKAPTRHLEELQRYVHQPQMLRLTYDDVLLPASQAMEKLQQLIADFDIWDDPCVKSLRRCEDPKSQRRLQEIVRNKSTESLKQLKALYRRTTELHQQVGQWASTYFLNACFEKMREKVAHRSNMVVSSEIEEEIFLYRLLLAVVGENITRPCSGVEDCEISPKAMLLLGYLQQEYTEHLTGIIFVKERSTATILSHLISNHPITHQRFAAQPIVGSSSFARKQTLVDLADLKAQNAALADFRSGKANILVCTSVMEEGMDISLTNLVLRFDEPSNFRSFIQSRGRARTVESKFVLMCGQDDPASKLPKWEELEAEMKSKYMDEMRQVAQRVEDEEEDEGYDEFLFSDATGARLSIHDAKGHLEHFCACLPTVPYADPPRPDYILTSSEAGHYTTDVLLPDSVTVEPRRFSGKLAWKSEIMATKDAAFRAYARLYEAGLINHNLLPTALPDPLVLVGEDETEGKESILSVRGRMSPWTCPIAQREIAYRKILTVRAQFSESEQLSQLYLLVPAAFDISMAFKLFWTVEQSITVDIHSGRLAGDVLQDQEFQRLAVLSTQLLLESVFLKKMQRRSEMAQASLFLVVPFLETTSLQKWLSECTGYTPIKKVDELRPEQELIRIKWWPKDERPYIFRSMELRCREPYWIRDPSDPPQPAIEEIHFKVKRLPKRLDYLHPLDSKDFGTAVESVPAADCYLDRLPPTYAKFMLLIPSILHKIEIRLVATALRQNLLSSVCFRGLGLVEHAVCASAANEGNNYQRLELIGDSVLKFWTSAQLCAQFPSWHEGYLSKGKDRLVNNFHLRRAARDQGLDEYIHTVPLAGSRWRPPVIELGVIEPPSSAQRDMSSKVLADVVEALIGASFLDGEDDQERNIKVKACLTTFLAGVAWRSPAENASILEALVPRESREFDNFRLLTEVTDFSFEKIVLLVQGLTHPSHPPVGVQGTYQRLEFLGDSILDFIVVETMARHSRQIPHFTMHLIRSAVVNAHLLAFYCLGTGLEQGCTKVTTKAGSRSVDILTDIKKTYLWEYMRHSGKLELVTAQKACAKRFDKLSLSIDAALGHGRSHPWHLLLSLKAAKFFSDIIESILGAIFIDSKGNLEACKKFLRRLGLLGYLHRIMAENIDVMHPKERLGMLAGNSKVRYVVAKSVVDNTAQYSCTVLVDDEPTAVSAGEVNKAAAEARAAEEAIALIVKEKEIPCL